MSDRDTSTEPFRRLVDERHKEFKRRMARLIEVLGGDNREDRLARAKAALDSANTLQLALAGPDRPEWLEPLRTALEQYVLFNAQPGNTSSMIDAIGRSYGAAIKHQWAFLESDDGGFDFDGVFRKYESESNIPALFDKLVEILEQVIQCEELDSRKVIHTLETIIATLKKNRNGSYFGVLGTWDFFVTYMKNFAWNVLITIPVLAPAVKALRETIEETDKQIEKVSENVQTYLQRELQAEFPVLAYQPLLPTRLALPDDTGGDIINVEAIPVGDQIQKPSC